MPFLQSPRCSTQYSLSTEAIHFARAVKYSATRVMTGSGCATGGAQVYPGLTHSDLHDTSGNHQPVA